jgi:ribosomal protein S6--L-glutamate ligase
MKIAILSQDASLYSTRRLKEAGEARGHDMRVINYLRCYMNITSHKPKVVYQGKVLEELDAIIPRIGASKTFYGTAVVRQFEVMGVFTAMNPKLFLVPAISYAVFRFSPVKVWDFR